jgi:hypothetical protein
LYGSLKKKPISSGLVPWKNYPKNSKKIFLGIPVLNPLFYGQKIFEFFWLQLVPGITIGKN